MERSTIILSDRAQSHIKNYLPDNSTLDRLVTFFSIFSDHSRLRIVSALALTEMCVNDIAAILNLNQTTVSHQLNKLKLGGAVKARREGKIIMYSLANDLIKEVMLGGVEYIDKN